MADKHPYVQSPGPLTQVLNHLKNSFPQTLTAETLRKLGYAPNNESYVLNTLRFLGLINNQDARTELASKIFTLHEPAAFSEAFSDVLTSSYFELFNLHGDASWTLDQNKLITFFRQTDQSTQLVGKLQARTFQVLCAYAGHGELPEAKAKQNSSKSKVGRTSSKKVPASKSNEKSFPEVALVRPDSPPASSTNRDFGLTVRIEINLPANGDQETYDRIFRSIKENLLHG